MLFFLLKVQFFDVLLFTHFLDDFTPNMVENSIFLWVFPQGDVFRGFFLAC